jgi:hypothetical protein
MLAKISAILVTLREISRHFVINGVKRLLVMHSPDRTRMLEMSCRGRLNNSSSATVLFTIHNCNCKNKTFIFFINTVL